MNRREAIGIIGLSASALAFRSCQQRQSSLEDLVRTLGNAIALLVTVNGNPQLAAKIRADTDAVIALIRVWKEGQDPSEIIRAINVLINDIQTLPIPPNFKPLITLALGTLAAIIERLNGREKPTTDVRITDPPKNSEEFKRNWDSIRAGSVDMQKAPIL